MGRSPRQLGHAAGGSWGGSRHLLALNEPPRTALPPHNQVNRLGRDNTSLQERLHEAQAAAAVDAADAEGSSGAVELAAARQDKAGLEARCAQLEGELRKSKRREEKLQVRAGARAGLLHLLRCASACRACPPPASGTLNHPFLPTPPSPRRPCSSGCVRTSRRRAQTWPPTTSWPRHEALSTSWTGWPTARRATSRWALLLQS